MSVPLTLWLFSDFACPWCYLVERSTVPRLRQDFDVRVRWVGFELHPETPPGGAEIASLIRPERLVAMRRRLEEAADRLGLPLQIPSRVPNTRVALGVAEFGRRQGGLDRFRALALDAGWGEGRDLGDHAVLEELAAAAGMDPGAALRFALSPDGEAAVRAQGALAAERGVTVIPTLLLGRLPVLGCQPYEALARAAQRAGLVPRPLPSANSAPVLRVVRGEGTAVEL